MNWSCPQCGAPLTDRNFGPERRWQNYRDIHGREIQTYRAGNCHRCWNPVELVNGELARTTMAPAEVIQSVLQPEEDA